MRSILRNVKFSFKFANRYTKNHLLLMQQNLFPGFEYEKAGLSAYNCSQANLLQAKNV
jgi:hypothetical protein